MKIGIVNDSPMATEALRRALAFAPEHRLCWCATNGAEAVERCAGMKPDLVLMDLIMPVMDGVEATRRIMMQSPCTILIVTSSVEANASRVFEAMGYGALDAVDTPALGLKDAKAGAAVLLAKIAVMEKFAEQRQVRRRTASRDPASGSSPDNLVAIGASAGGPKAIAAVLDSLPHDFPAAIAIVQHVDACFAQGFAEWLGKQSKIPVRLAKEGDRLEPGVALLAGSDDHMALKGAFKLGYVAEPQDYFYRPSVDVFFQSVSMQWEGRAAGVLLTGMGYDGALGLKSLRVKGHHTIAQDEASCAVYGMPKAAAAMNAATEVLSLEQIGPKLAKIFRRQATGKDR